MAIAERLGALSFFDGMVMDDNGHVSILLALHLQSRSVATGCLDGGFPLQWVWLDLIDAGSLGHCGYLLSGRMRGVSPRIFIVFLSALHGLVGDVRYVLG